METWKNTEKSIFGDMDYLGKFKIKEAKQEKPKKKGFITNIKEIFTKSDDGN